MAKHIPRPDADTRPVDRLISPIQEFLRVEAAGGIILLACALIAIVWANSPWSASYESLWQTPFTVGFGDFVLEKALILWVNDGLMAVFFFVVGLEIKRELLVGELSSLRQAVVPIAAAIGGMACPALVYAAINWGGDGLDGWAIPAATDIAFALGIVALVGPRVPIALKVFVTATAIVDDICAVLIIALFYTSGISTTALWVSGGLTLLLVIANRLHVRHPVIYLLLGMALWVAVLKSGLHATIAGVVVAFTIPARMKVSSTNFLDFTRRKLDRFAETDGDDIMRAPERQVLAHAIEDAARDLQTPLNRLETRLHPWVAFVIMPVFALANAGVALGSGLFDSLVSSISLGVIGGLLVGKQLGIMGMSWLAIRFGPGELPEGSTWKQLYAASWLAGIGFTMSLFIASLGFGEGEPLEASKIGVLFGSLIAGSVGFFLLRHSTRNNPVAD